MCLTCILVVEVSKCNGREDAGKIEEDGGRDGFLKYEHLVQILFCWFYLVLNEDVFEMSFISWKATHIFIALVYLKFMILMVSYLKGKIEENGRREGFLEVFIPFR